MCLLPNGHRAFLGPRLKGSIRLLSGRAVTANYRLGPSEWGQMFNVRIARDPLGVRGVGAVRLTPPPNSECLGEPEAERVGVLRTLEASRDIQFLTCAAVP